MSFQCQFKLFVAFYEGKSCRSHREHTHTHTHELALTN